MRRARTTRALWGAIALAAILAGGWMLARWHTQKEETEDLHDQGDETELAVSNLMGAEVRLYRAGEHGGVFRFGKELRHFLKVAKSRRKPDIAAICASGHKAHIIKR